jgi:hypothetical protein
MGLEIVSDGCGSAPDNCGAASITAPAAKTIDQSENIISDGISLRRISANSICPRSDSIGEENGAE